MGELSAEQVVARIKADNDQHQAAALARMREQSMSELIDFWMWLQQEFSDPRTEMMSRFAAIAVAPMLAAEWLRRLEADKENAR